jgi:hypothetical protein
LVLSFATTYDRAVGRRTKTNYREQKMSTLNQFETVIVRRTPAEKNEFDRAFMARCAARRDERVGQIMRFGQTVFYSFIDGRYVEGDAEIVMQALDRHDSKDDRVVVRITPTLANMYRARGVFPELCTGRNEIRAGQAFDMLDDAMRLASLTDDQSERNTYRSIARQIHDLTRS